MMSETVQYRNTSFCMPSKKCNMLVKCMYRLLQAHIQTKQVKTKRFHAYFIVHSSTSTQITLITITSFTELSSEYVNFRYKIKLHNYTFLTL